MALAISRLKISLKDLIRLLVAKIGVATAMSRTLVVFFYICKCVKYMGMFCTTL